MSIVNSIRELKRKMLSQLTASVQAPSCSESLLGELPGRVRESAVPSAGQAAEGCACFEKAVWSLYKCMPEASRQRARCGSPRFRKLLNIRRASPPNTNSHNLGVSPSITPSTYRDLERIAPTTWKQLRPAT